MATKVAIEVDVKTGDLEARLAKVESALEKVKKQGKETSNEITSGFQSAGQQAQMFGGPVGRAVGIMNALKMATLKFVGTLKTVRVAVAATGIGALVIAVFTLIEYFTKTERGAQALRVITAALGATMGALMDVVIAIGETIFRAFTEPKQVFKEFATSIKTYVIDQVTNILDGLGLLGSAIQKVFSGDFTGAMEDAEEGAKKLGEGLLKLNPATAPMIALTSQAVELGKEINKDAQAAINLANAFNKLKVSQRVLSVETAQRRADIIELNKAAEDVTLSYKEREDAAQKAANIEDELLKKKLANAAENVRIIKEQNSLSENGEDDLQKLADAEIELATTRMESMELQTKIQNKLNTIRQQQVAETNAAMAKAKENRKKEKEELEKEIAEEEKRREEAVKKELDLLEQLKDTRLALIQDEQTQKEEAVKLDLERKLAQIEGDSIAEIELRKNLEEIADQELGAIQQEFKDKELVELEEQAKKKKAIEDKAVADVKKAEEDKKKLRMDGLSAAGSVLGALDKLITASGSNSKQALALQKTLAVAQIAIDTAKAIVGAIAQAQSVPYPGNLVAIATGVAAVIAGIASAVTTLNSADVGGASAAQPQAPQVTSAPAVQQATAGTTELGGAEQAQLAPIQAFVVETEVTGNQNNVNQIESQANFG
jgi:hypothetical protein